MIVNIIPEKLSNASGKVAGVINLKGREKVFPEADWNDFVVIVASWWLQNLLPLLDGGVDFAEFRFMDGPFSMRVAGTTGKVLFTCMSHDRVHFTEEGELSEFRNSLLNAVSEIIFYCEVNELEDSDVRELKRLRALF